MYAERHIYENRTLKEKKIVSFVFKSIALHSDTENKIQKIESYFDK